MRAARFILFGILLALIGAYAPNAIAGLLYTNAGTLNPTLGNNGLYLYLAQIILIGLGFIMGLTGFFLKEPIPVPSAVDLPSNIPLQASQVPQKTLPPDFH